MISVAISSVAIALSGVSVYYSVKAGRIAKQSINMRRLRQWGLRIDENGNEVQL